MTNAPKVDESSIDAALMAKLRAPFACEYVGGRWRIHDANNDCIASTAEAWHGRLIVFALNKIRGQPCAVCLDEREVCRACGVVPCTSGRQCGDQYGRMSCPGCSPPAKTLPAG